MKTVQYALILFTVIVPKNQGLRRYREKTLGELGLERAKQIEVRGEDVPFWVEELLKQDKQAIGFTGEDLFKEWCLEHYTTPLKILKRIAWNDSQALFGKPTLCLLGSAAKQLDDLPKMLRVCIASKYKLIAKKYLNFLEQKGYTFEKIYVKGSVETSCSEGIADLIIDIVYTGSSMNKYGLRVYDTILASDFVVIGSENGDENET